MKNTIKAFALAVLAAGFVSCVDKPEFTTGPFVSLYRTSASVAESVNGTVYNIPVKLYNSTAGTSVSYSISGTAVNGLDYTLADQSGVLNIPAGADSAAIAVPLFLMSCPDEAAGTHSTSPSVSKYQPRKS